MVKLLFYQRFSMYKHLPVAERQSWVFFSKSELNICFALQTQNEVKITLSSCICKNHLKGLKILKRVHSKVCQLRDVCGLVGFERNFKFYWLAWSFNGASPAFGFAPGFPFGLSGNCFLSPSISRSFKLQQKLHVSLSTSFAITFV